MTSTETAPADELSRRVLGIIRAYRMGIFLDTRELCVKRTREADAEAVVVPTEGHIRNGVYHPAETSSPPRLPLTPEPVASDEDGVLTWPRGPTLHVASHRAPPIPH